MGGKREMLMMVVGGVDVICSLVQATCHDRFDWTQQSRSGDSSDVSDSETVTVASSVAASMQARGKEECATWRWDSKSPRAKRGGVLLANWRAVALTKDLLWMTRWRCKITTQQLTSTLPDPPHTRATPSCSSPRKPWDVGSAWDGGDGDNAGTTIQA